jgi:hypothetical protein
MYFFLFYNIRKYFKFVYENVGIDCKLDKKAVTSKSTVISVIQEYFVLHIRALSFGMKVLMLRMFV